MRARKSSQRRLGPSMTDSLLSTKTRKGRGEEDAEDRVVKIARERRAAGLCQPEVAPGRRAGFGDRQMEEGTTGRAGPCRTVPREEWAAIGWGEAPEAAE